MSAWEGLNGPYSTIVADPPWLYQKNPNAKRLAEGLDVSGGRGGIAERLYTTMSNEEIAALPVADLAADQAHLYLWLTNPGVYGGRFSDLTPADIATSWGFTYVTMLTWVKPGSGGMGWYFRGQTEHVLFGTRGDLGIPSDKREPNVVMARRTGHSVKPAAFFDLVERVSPGPYVELFARQPRLGWDAWGLGVEGAA